jgi:hypothetical protein
LGYCCFGGVCSHFGIVVDFVVFGKVPEGVAGIAVFVVVGIFVFDDGSYYI